MKAMIENAVYRAEYVSEAKEEVRIYNDMDEEYSEYLGSYKVRNGLLIEKTFLTNEERVIGTLIED